MKGTETRKKSLSGKSVKGLALLGIVMLLMVSIASGVTLYIELMNIYTKMAFSYAYLSLSQISGEQVLRIISAGGEFADFRRDHQKIIDEWSDGDDPVLTEEAMQLLREKYENFDELEELMQIYSSLSSSVLVGGNLLEGISGFSIVVPDENGYTCIVDSDLVLAYEFLDRVPYSGEKEKALLLNAWNGQEAKDLEIYREGDRLIGKLAMPIFLQNGDPVAVLFLEVPVTQIRFAFLRLLLILTVGVLIIMILSILIYFNFIRKSFLFPVQKLNHAAQILVPELKKDQPLQVDVHTGDELDTLARSFEQMDDMLRHYIRENASITAERERISTELSLAARIQADMLPNEFPAFPERSEFDIYATMTPAKEVGGDFYDFFLPDQTHLALVMADVSGKGVPAALFMMMAKIMLQNFLMTGMHPKDVLSAVNRQLCRSNKEEMFVTVWIGILDLDTGLLTASNAGHEYPVLKNPGKPFALLKDRHGFVIGGMDDIRYSEYELQLEKGTALFVYTDGLPEAQDKEGRLLGMDRVLKALNRDADPDSDPRKVLQTVQQVVDDYVGHEPAFDDLTMLCMVYHGNEEENEAAPVTEQDHVKHMERAGEEKDV